MTFGDLGLKQENGGKLGSKGFNIPGSASCIYLIILTCI